MNPPPPDSYAELRRVLLAHYDEHQRRLPWRGETDPYRILVSEVMLQQTRVQTVVGYYEAWLSRFPDLESLAAADVDDVLEAWEGLGYYRRARNLHRTAQVVRERPDGSLPSGYEALRELPGVGEYTAGALASIAFGEVVPAPDGNVRRVLARLFDEPQPRPAWLREAAAALVDPERPGDWNQALMELGATVCTPRAPRCGACPLVAWCAANARGVQEERPVATRRSAPRRAIFALAVLHVGGRVMLVKRPVEGLLGGMWAFPEKEVADAGEADAAAMSVAGELLDGVGRSAEPLPAREHRFTHLHVTYLPYLIQVAGPMEAEGVRALAKRPRLVWVDVDDPSGVALPVAQRGVLGSARDRLASAVT
jgi:A/G-specific adenine glycosylase